MPDLHALDPIALLAVATVLVLVQCSLVVGFLVPAGKASVLAGVLAGTGLLDPWLTYLSLATAAIAGAGAGFLVGRLHGEGLVEHRLLAHHRHRVARAQDLARRRAGFALLVGRSIAILRATTPALAGAAGVGRRRFWVFNVLGGLLWAAVFVGSGFLGGRFLPGIPITPTGAAVALAAGLVLVALVVAIRSRSAASVPRQAD